MSEDFCQVLGSVPMGYSPEEQKVSFSHITDIKNLLLGQDQSWLLAKNANLLPELLKVSKTFQIEFYQIEFNYIRLNLII